MTLSIAAMWSASKACRIGLVDDVLPAPGFQDRVREWTRAVADGGKPRRAARPLLKRLLDDTAPGRGVVLAAARRSWLAKAGGNYLNSQLVRIEANMNGYDEGIVLGTDGLVSEGSGENIFAIKNGSIVTPESHYGILPGITRHTAITLMRDLGMKVEQRGIPREFLYIADEVFFTGTAAEITPIRAIDKIQIGAGERGPITAQIQDAFFKVIRAEVEDKHGWLTFV